MILCIMALCTLFAMDWYYRTYIHKKHHHYNPTNLFNINGTITFNDLKNDNKTLGNGSIKKGKVNLAHFVEKKIWIRPKDPTGIPLASQCIEISSHCPVFCCNSGSSHSSLVNLIETENYINLISKLSKHPTLNYFDPRNSNLFFIFYYYI